MILAIVFFLLGISTLWYKDHKNHNILSLQKREKIPTLCILIPARYESKVINDLLLSIEKQTVFIPTNQVYVIVESIHDPSVSIVKGHHMNVFVRKTTGKTKGYALQEIIENLCQNHLYFDCYFIFDADNVLDTHFIEEMIKDYQKGYFVSTGYRAIKNCNAVIPISAALTFSLINDIHNRNMLKHDGNMLLSGTGYYISGELIQEWKTFPFHTLTEDYESSLYYTCQNISTHYNTKAVFYDDQPRKYQISIKQRSRWIKGYFQNWFHYQRELKKMLNSNNSGSVLDMKLGILPILLFLMSFVCFFLWAVFHHYFSFLCLLVLLIYVGTVIFSFYLLSIVCKNQKISFWLKIGVSLYHPIFLLSYVHAFFVAIGKKNLVWERIER